MSTKNTFHFTLDTISSLPIPLLAGGRIFLRGDLGAGKTTLTKSLLCRLLGENIPVKSPTYVYYNKYDANIYHFDLYRLTSYDDFVNIGGEEILGDPNNICIIEWPEVIENYYVPTVDVSIRKIEGKEGEREIDISTTII